MASKSILSAVIRRGRPACLDSFRNGNTLSSFAATSGNAFTSNKHLNRLVPNSSYAGLFPPCNYFHTGRWDYSGVIKCADCSHAYSRNVDDFVNLVSCPKCGALQKMVVSELPDYFQILSQPRSYRLDVNKISNRTKQLQKIFHPDLYGNEGNDQQSLSQDYSSLVNKAFSTLAHPIERGRYLLSLGGVLPDDGGRKRNRDDDEEELERTITSNDPEFLRIVMDMNEELEEIGDTNDWRRLRSKTATFMTDIDKALADAFEFRDLDEAKVLLDRLKYFDTIDNKLKEMKSRIGIVE